MSASQESNIVDNKFRVTSIEKTDPPEGMDGNWYHYVIGRNGSNIEGKRKGTLKGVTKHAEEFADNLNQRGVKGYSSYAPRSQKKQTPKAT
jgi:hypothetical protein